MWLFYESAVSKNLSEKSSLAKPRLKKTSKKTIIAQWVEFTHKVTLAILKHLNADSISDTYQAPKQSTKIQMPSTLKVNAARFARSVVKWDFFDDFQTPFGKVDYCIPIYNAVKVSLYLWYYGEELGMVSSFSNDVRPWRMERRRRGSSLLRLESF